MTTINNLGTDQWKWLNKFGSIDLTHWRMDIFKEHGNVPVWYYVGKWKPKRVKSYEEDSNTDGGYTERSCNLKHDRYFYWPTSTRID